MVATSFEIPHEWDEPQDLHETLVSIREARPDANIRKIRYAYFLAEKAHKGQTRDSGLPYIIHPLSVANILVELRMDDDSIVAALLHDVLEDCTSVTAVDIEKAFGADVLHLVEGVTKLAFKPHGDLDDRQRAQAETTRTAETLRKMLLAMAKDFRVMVIKLADRLHNMQTIDAVSPIRRARIANETLDVYAPLAARLGIWQIKWQLEDLCFKALHPTEFSRVSELVAKTRVQREKELNEAVLAIKSRFQERGLQVIDIRGRPKHLYSIFNKMVKGNLEFTDINDLLALRIIVETVPECYQALGVVHESFVPLPSLFYDYIARPKPNGYQSLHTKVLGPGGGPLEIQIRTRAMHETAEHGVAAHWTYKEGKAQVDETKRLGNLRQQLLEWSNEGETSSDYLRTLGTDLFSEQVFVFTPKGDVIDMPAGATPIDFAFRVHSQLGMTLVGAKVNGSIVPLSTELQNGDVCELVVRSNASPSLDWLEFTKSAHTKAKLRSYFRKLTKNDDALRGKSMLEKELRSLGLDPKAYLGEDKLLKVAETLNSIETVTDLYAKVGTGLVSTQNVVDKLRGHVQELPSADQIHLTKTREGKLQLTTGGLTGVLVSRGKCCAPVPGDDVVGYVTRGRGIVVHRRVCPNAQAFLTSEPDRLLNYAWPPDGNVYAVNLQILCTDRPGLMMDVMTVFGESKTNVSAARTKTSSNNTANIEVTADFRDTDHLQAITTKLGNYSDVISVLRVFGRTAGK
jgi:guanosine-3',5'-bis(diphosphate) 3'-pyrophosphohydrolase